MLRISFSLIWIFFASGAFADTNYLGLKRLPLTVAGVELSVRVFYPTSVPAEPTAFGPWVLKATPNAEPRSGAFPMIIISHGLGGNDWNYHLLAAKLVEAGFVVGAVRHPDDLMRVGQQEILVLRPLEMRAAIDAVLADPVLGQNIDEDNIGAFGFSQGGLTVLRAVGAEADHQRLIDHCIKQSEQDEEFCTGKSTGLLKRIGQLVRRMFYVLPEIDLATDVADPRIKAIVAAAPVGVPVTDQSAIKTPTWLIRAGGDSVLGYPFHVEYLHKSLSADHEYTVLEGIEHYAFLSPFPAKIAAEVGLPAQDPKGFDRAAFLDGLNEKIVGFFTMHLKN